MLVNFSGTAEPGERDLATLAIIIVNWNVRDLLDKCLASIERSRFPQGENRALIETIVVDCASDDGSAAMVRAKYPGVRLLAESENLGFTRGNNLGLSRSGAPFLLLLNPDTEVSQDALALMLAYMQRHPRVGIVGPRTLNSDGSHQSTRRRFPSLTTALFESTWLAKFAPPGLLDRYFMRGTDDHAIMPVDWAQGSALMLRRELLGDIGGLDEGYMMYSEELDYCKRAKAANWQVVYHGGAVITHHGGKSSDQAPAFAQIHFHSSKLRYFRKHHGFGAYLILRVNLLLQFLWQLLLEAGKALLGHKRELRLRRIKTYWKALRSGLKAGA